MQAIRQRRKETSLNVHPSASLHLVQLAKLVQDYQHARMLLGVNLTAAAVVAVLPEAPDARQQSFDLSLDVPYIQSEHYESNETFVEQPTQQHMDSHQNFTDEEEDTEQQPRHRKVVVLEEEEEYREQDFKFVARDSSGRESSYATFPYGSTKHSKQSDTTEKPAELEICHLQETAYFSQAPEPEGVGRRLSYGGTKECLKQNESGGANKSQAFNGCSKKAILLNKIEKEKSRKQIAELISRERHHLRRFLK